MQTTCFCVNECAGDTELYLQGQVCTNASDPENVEQAKRYICDAKETIGFRVCKIKDCIPLAFSPVTPAGCPADNGDFAAGHFGQSISSAGPQSHVDVSGDDINDFSITPDSFEVQTTHTGSQLQVNAVAGVLGETTFTTDGIFGDDEHTLADGQMYGEPFSVAIDPDGSYAIPAGVANFMVTGLVDGDRLSLTAIGLDLAGTYDEEAGVFTMNGTAVAQGADIAFDVTLDMQFQNRPPRAVAEADAVVECSSPDGVGSAAVSAANSYDLDGPADLARYTWYLDDAEVAQGVSPLISLPLGENTLNLVVADRAGRFGDDTLSLLVVDSTAPQINIASPQPDAYAHSETLVLDFAAEDACTGVTTTVARIDGADSLSGHELESGQPIDLLGELSLGTHVFSVDSEDAEGNATREEVTFEVIATPQSLQEAIEQLVASGAITQPSRGTSLLRPLGAAARAYTAGNCAAAVGSYGAFISAVNAQTGKSIDSTAAAILIADAQYLIDHCA